MTPQERQEFDQLKSDFGELRNQFYKGDFPEAKRYSKKLIAQKEMEVTGQLKINATSGLSGSHIHSGVNATSADIKAELGHTCPNGSLYLSSSTTQPVLIMVITTWQVLNIP